MDGECGDHHRYSFGIGDVYLYGDDDEWMYGWYEHCNGNHYGDAEQFGRSCIFHAYTVCEHGTYQYYPHNDRCNGDWLSNRITGRSHGIVGQQYHHNQRQPDGNWNIQLYDSLDRWLWNRERNGHDHSDPEQYNCVEFGGGNQRADTLY